MTYLIIRVNLAHDSPLQSNWYWSDNQVKLLCHAICSDQLYLIYIFRLLQARLEKEEFEEELKELQEKVSTMKQQIPDPSHTQTLNQVQ